MKHPGKVTVVDGDGKVLSVIDAATMPESMRFRPTDSGLVPVVKVVLSGSGPRRTRLEYGPKGEFLQSTTLVEK